MKNAIILHGTANTPAGNWFTWLQAELEKAGLRVWLPQLPHSEQPSLHDMADFVRAGCPFPLDAETFVVGHSSGAILALILAQQNPVPLGGVVGVSVFHDNSLRWEPNAKLFDVPFNWAAIRARAGKLLFVHSDNDPYVPLGQARYVADNCGTELLVIPGQGHFNLERSPDYTQFPKLLYILQEHGYLAEKRRVTIVNEQDEIIDYKQRRDVAQQDIYRVSALWLTNPRGDILLAQRSLAKKHHPGLWGPAVAGTVEEGETYDENIVKEAEEEIGLTGIHPVASKKERVTGGHNHFTQWYTLTVDKTADEFAVQPEEVAQVKWFTRAELEQELRGHPEHYLRTLPWCLQNL